MKMGIKCCLGYLKGREHLSRLASIKGKGKNKAIPVTGRGGP
jgi:hypothetical protein